MVDPARPFFSDEGVGQAVGLVTEGVFQSDQAIAALA